MPNSVISGCPLPFSSQTGNASPPAVLVVMIALQCIAPRKRRFQPVRSPPVSVLVVELAFIHRHHARQCVMQSASVIAVPVAGRFEVLNFAAHVGYRVGMPAPVCQKQLVHVAVLVNDALRPEALVLLVCSASVLTLEWGQG